MKIFKQTAVLLLALSGVLARSKPAGKAFQPYPVPAQAAQIPPEFQNQLASREVKKNAKERRRLAGLSDLSPSNIRPRGWGMAAGMTGVVMTRQGRYEQRSELSKLRSAVGDQSSLLRSKQFQLSSLLNGIDDKMSKMRSQMTSMKEQIFDKITKYQRTMKAKASGDDPLFGF